MTPTIYFYGLLSMTLVTWIFLAIKNRDKYQYGFPFGESRFMDSLCGILAGILWPLTIWVLVGWIQIRVVENAINRSKNK